MEYLPQLLTTLNPMVIGGSSVFIMIVGYLYFRKNKGIQFKSQKKQPKMKAAVKKSDVPISFDPDTYTVETEEHIIVPRNISGPVILRQRNNGPSFGESRPSYSDEDKESTDPLYYLDLAKSLDRKGNRENATQTLIKAIKFQTNPSEKIKYENVLFKYQNDPFCNLKDLLLHKDNVDLNDTQEIPASSFTYIEQKKIMPNSDPTLKAIAPKVPSITTSSIAKVQPNLNDLLESDLVDIPKITGLNYKANTSDTNELDFTTPAQLAEAINSGNIDSTAHESKEINMSESQQHSADNLPANHLAHDIWVHWMSTANGKTSFKSNTIHLHHPWTSKKAIKELTEILSRESKNSDGTSAGWSILSIHPFFDF